MFIPIHAAAYFYLWVSHTMTGVNIPKVQEGAISCTTTVNDIITNDEYYNINTTIESVFIKNQ